MKVKDFGQVFTPINIVNDVLDAAGYLGENILKKHVIDNSWGDGAFLIEIVNRYIDVYEKKYRSLDGIESDLKKYVHPLFRLINTGFYWIKNNSALFGAVTVKKRLFD